MAGCFSYNQYTNGSCERIIGVWDKHKTREDEVSDIQAGFFHDYCFEYQTLNYRKILEFFIVYKLG